MYNSLDGFSFALGDYAAVNIGDYMGSPELNALGAIIDPVVYIDYLKTARLITPIPITTTAIMLFLFITLHIHFLEENR